MKILIVAALQREIAPLARKRLSDVELLVTGEGRANAERALRQWLEQKSADAVICMGLAGALSIRLQVGDLLIDKQTSLGAILSEKIAAQRFQTLATDRPLNHPASEPSADDFSPLHFGNILTVDEILNAAGKGRLAATLEPDEVACVEMESAAIAKLCLEKQIPVLLLRAISDLRDEDFPIDFNACRNRDGRVSTAKVWQQVLRKPQAIAGLLQFNRRVNLCAERLALFVEQAILLLGEHLEDS